LFYYTWKSHKCVALFYYTWKSHKCVALFYYTWKSNKCVALFYYTWKSHINCISGILYFKFNGIDGIYATSMCSRTMLHIICDFLYDKRDYLKFSHWELSIYMQQHSSSTCIWNIYISLYRLSFDLRILITPFGIFKIFLTLSQVCTCT
jgi:hypothetical protein